MWLWKLQAAMARLWKSQKRPQYIQKKKHMFAIEHYLTYWTIKGIQKTLLIYFLD
jgi:hypothetical protein